MSVFSTISFDECVAVAKFRLGLRTTDYDIYLSDIAAEAVRQTDTLSLFLKKICTLGVDDKKSELPCDYQKIIGLRFGSGNACGDLIYANLEYLRECGCSISPNVISFNGIFEISDGHIFYHSIGDDVTEVTLSYWGLNTDSNGRPVVREYYRRAIVAYICYVFCLANMNEARYARQVEEHRETWKAQKKWIKSADTQDEFRNTKHQIRSIMNGLISDKQNWITV